MSGILSVTTCGGIVSTVNLPTVTSTAYPTYTTTTSGVFTTTVGESTTMIIPTFFESFTTATNISIDTSEFSVSTPMIQLYHKPEDIPNPVLAPGEKAAIGVTIPIVVFAFVAFPIVFLLHRRKRSATLVDESQYRDKPELETRNLPEAPVDAQVSE